MYKVNICGEQIKMFDTLDEAMSYAKSLDKLVEIVTPNYTIVGKFGADGVVKGKCPDGHVYDWKKRR